LKCKNSALITQAQLFHKLICYYELELELEFENEDGDDVEVESRVSHLESAAESISIRAIGRFATQRN
jgi:activator of HSP90 ATPase